MGALHIGRDGSLHGYGCVVHWLGAAAVDSGEADIGRLGGPGHARAGRVFYLRQLLMTAYVVVTQCPRNRPRAGTRGRV